MMNWVILVPYLLPFTSMHNFFAQLVIPQLGSAAYTSLPGGSVVGSANRGRRRKAARLEEEVGRFPSSSFVFHLWWENLEAFSRVLAALKSSATADNLHPFLPSTQHQVACSWGSHSRLPGIWISACWEILSSQRSFLFHFPLSSSSFFPHLLSLNTLGFSDLFLSLTVLYLVDNSLYLSFHITVVVPIPWLNPDW